MENDIIRDIFSKCLDKGNIDARYPDNHFAYRLFERHLGAGEWSQASRIFSDQRNQRGKEELLRIAFKEFDIPQKEMQDLIVNVYQQKDENQTFLSYYDDDKMVRDLFSIIEAPYISSLSIDKEKYQQLENELTIYRGLKNKPKDNQNYGYSWTLDKDVSMEFAKMNNKNASGYIISGCLNKSDIIMYLRNKNEEEIVCFPENVSDVIIEEVQLASNENNH
jgi:hypothetical protein